MEKEDSPSTAKQQLDFKKEVGAAAASVAGDQVTIQHQEIHHHYSERDTNNTNKKPDKCYESHSFVIFSAVATFQDTPITRAKLRAIQRQLSLLGEDCNIEIVGLDEGSIKIIVQGSKASREHIEDLFQSGNLTELDDIPITEIRELSKEEQEQKKRKGVLVRQILNNCRSKNKDKLNLANANLVGVSLVGIDLSGCDLRGCKLMSCDLEEATLTNANLEGANLAGANLEGAILKQTNLKNASLVEANCEIATLFGANLEGSNLTRANFERANLCKVQASGANFTESILTDACVDSWIIDDSTNFQNVSCERIYLKWDSEKQEPIEPVFSEQKNHFKHNEFTSFLSHTTKNNGSTINWPDCVVRIDNIDKNMVGNGFFVGQSLVLTCKHVVDQITDKRAMTLWWKGKKMRVQSIQASDTSADLALIRLKNKNLNHNWVGLSSHINPRERLETFAYSPKYIHGSQYVFEYEGSRGDGLIKFKDGQVTPGFSGAPLVNRNTKKVCGVINKTSDRRWDFGGLAIPMTTVWSSFPTLKPKVSEIPKNPFVPISGRIDLPEQFFGRQKELTNVFEILNSGSSVAIIGERQVGKSSFLKAITNNAKSRLTRYRRPVYLNFQDIYDDADFYEALCFEIGLEETLKGFRLKRAISKLDPPILLLLDEVEKMKWGGFSLQIRSQLRSLAEGNNAPLRLVLASSINLDELFPDSQGHISPFKNICLNEYLSLWDEEQVRQFIQVRLEPTPIRFSEQDIIDILSQTNGHPQKVMEACFKIYNQYQNNNS